MLRYNVIGRMVFQNHPIYVHINFNMIITSDSIYIRTHTFCGSPTLAGLQSMF